MGRNLREIPFHIYDKYIGHKLSDDEIKELKMNYEECNKNKLRAAGACCFATAGTFIKECCYINDILNGNDLSIYQQYRNN